MRGTEKGISRTVLRPMGLKVLNIDFRGWGAAKTHFLRINQGISLTFYTSPTDPGFSLYRQECKILENFVAKSIYSISLPAGKFINILKNFQTFQPILQNCEILLHCVTLILYKGMYSFKSFSHLNCLVIWSPFSPKLSGYLVSLFVQTIFQIHRLRWAITRQVKCSFSL